MRWNVPPGSTPWRCSWGWDCFFSCKGQRWGKSATNSILLSKKLFALYMAPLEIQAFPTVGLSALDAAGLSTATLVQGLKFSSCPKPVLCDPARHSHALLQQVQSIPLFQAFCILPDTASPSLLPMAHHGAPGHRCAELHSASSWEPPLCGLCLTWRRWLFH